MRRYQLLVAMTLLLAGAAAGRAQRADVAARMSPDTVLYNAKIVTMDDATFSSNVGNIAQAMAIKDGKILATGASAEIRALASSRTQQLDMKGRTVMPGFIGTHEHPLNAVYANYPVVRHAFPNDDFVIIRFMDYVPPQEQLKRFEPMVKELVAKARPGQGIMIHFNNGVEGEWSQELARLTSRTIKREYLNLLSPNNPIKVGTVVNQLAIDKLSAEHPTVSDVRRPNFMQTDNFGEGVRDFATGKWLEPDVFMRNNDAMIGALYKGQFEQWARYGYVAISSSAYGYNELRGLTYMDRRGEMPVRYGWAYGGPNYEVETLRWVASLTGTGTDHLWNVGAWERIGSDCTKAKLQQSWLDANPRVIVGARRGTRECNFAPGSIGRELLERLIETGNRIATMHTWGDVDVDYYMDAIEQASARAGMTIEQIRAKRHAMDHTINAPRQDQIPRLKNLGMLVSANNRFIVYQPAAEQVVDLFGVEQANQTAPRKSLVDGGIINSFEIDVSDPQLVFPLIKKGMDRFSERTGKVHGPGQRTDRVIQLKALTRWGAHYLLREDLMGTLEAGKFADFIVLDRDILTIPEEQIPDTQVLMTVMGGRTTHLSNALATELKQKPVGFVTWEVATPKGWEVPYYYEGPREAGTASCVGAGAATCREP